MRPALRCGSGDSALLGAIHARAVELPALRPPGGGFGGPGGDGAPWVVRVDPADGTAGVLADAPVVVTMSHPIEPGSLGPRTVRVRDGVQPVAGRMALSPDACVVIWTPERPLRSGLEHVVEVLGVRDLRGRDVRPHRSAFTVGHHTLDDLLEEPAR